MATGFTPPSPIELDTSSSVTAKETPPKLARVESVALDQNQNKEHVPVMCIQTSTAATLDTHDFDTPAAATGFSPPSPVEPAETIPVGDDDSPDLVPQFSKVQSLDEIPFPAPVQEKETPCVVHKAMSSKSKSSMQEMLELDVELAEAKLEAVRARVALAHERSSRGSEHVCL